MKNRFVILIQRMLLLFALYSACRIFFYLFNFSYFSDIEFGKVVKLFLFGLRFDAVAIVISNLLFIALHFYPFSHFYHKIYQAVLRVLFLFVNTIAVLLNVIDMEFVRFEGRRATTDAFRVMGFGDDFINTVPRMILDYWYLLLLLIAIVYVINKFYSRIKISTADAPTGFLFSSGIGQIILALVVFGLTFIGFRGGIQYRPVNIMTASKYASGKEVSLLLNTPFTMLKTLGKNLLVPMNYFSKEEAELISPVIHQPEQGKVFRPLNIVFIIVESLGKEYMGLLNNNEGYTPFLDSLIKSSIVFPNAYANGKRSIEGIPCIIAGIPALMDEPFITSAYNGNKITTIANTLEKKGYRTLFFHGGTNGTMGFDNFTKLSGYDFYYGRNEYNNDSDFDGNWGIFDEPFLQYSVKKMNETPQPFHATVFTLSSHHPYLIPEKYKGKFRKGTLPIHESIAYADYSLKNFFETAANSSWYNNTLFVITGDHTAISETPVYQTPAGLYSMPIIFYQPSDSVTGFIDINASQIDIIPGVLDYINYDLPFFSFGSSMFDTTLSHAAVNFINGTYQIISDNFALSMDTSVVHGLYDLRTDPLMNKNLKDSLPGIQPGLVRKLKAMIQNYNAAMMNNKMSAE